MSHTLNIPYVMPIGRNTIQITYDGGRESPRSVGGRVEATGNSYAIN